MRTGCIRPGTDSCSAPSHDRYWLQRSVARLQSADLMGQRDQPEVPISACSSRLAINPQRTLQVQASVTDSE